MGTVEKELEENNENTGIEEDRMGTKQKLHSGNFIFCVVLGVAF